MLFVAAICLSTLAYAGKKNKKNTKNDRELWVSVMTRIAHPVLFNTAQGTLKTNMPYESLSKNRQKNSYLEALGRTVCGIAPWLELGPDDTPEGKLRAQYIDLTVKSIANATNPASPDFMLFDEPYQPLVDAAFLAEGLLRAPKQLWGNLSDAEKANVVAALKSSRSIKAWESNWLLFASTVEAALLEFTGEYDADRLTYGVKRFRDDWYKGDGIYGDGPAFHADYYNSFVIHPMLTDVLIVMNKHGIDDGGFAPVHQKRQSRYAEQLERSVSPEGTYPVVGRSIVYRTGIFHALAQTSLLQQLPNEIKPEQVRSALTAVINNQYASPQNFDKEGWLRVGFAGEQLEMSESYINTGSLYLCMSGFLPLGLPADNAFWANPAADWTSKKAWNGINVKADHAIKN